MSKIDEEEYIFVQQFTLESQMTSVQNTKKSCCQQSQLEKWEKWR